MIWNFNIVKQDFLEHLNGNSEDIVRYYGLYIIQKH